MVAYRSRPLLAAALCLFLPFLVAVPAQAGARHPAPPSDSVIGRWGSDRLTTAEQYYFVLPDRFANGDTRNDRGGLTGDRLKTGFDPADKGFYHGGDLQGVIDKLDYIQGLGTTAIWLAPVFKNRPVQGSGDDVSAGYHGYWITDFTRVDPHFGTNDDLKRLVTLAHRRGMKIYLDIIVNHTADVIQYAENKYDYIDKAVAPYKDSAGRPFEDRNYADGRNGFPQVSTKSFPYTPVFPTAADQTVKAPSWLNDPTMYHNRGNSTFAGENSEYGDFYGLDDLWTERPDVVRGMTKIYADWIADTGVDGYRLDTVKHTDLDFWPQFSAGIRKAGGGDFFMFGEVYSADPEIESTYVRKGGLPATLDFSFQESARAFVTGAGSAQGLSQMYARDALYTARDTGADRLPTFLGNHDMGRIGSFIESSTADAGSYLRRDELAHELMFLTRGQPVVYSGDEQGFTGPGGDKDARQDMFASKTADYLNDDLIGTDRTHAVNNYNTAHPLYRTIAALAALRKANPALVTGEQIPRYASAGPGVFATSRIDRAGRNEYVVAANNATTAQTVTLDTWSAGSAFRTIYGGDGTTAAAADGKLTVTVPALSTVVLRAGTPVAVPAAAPAVTITAPAAGALVPIRAQLTARVTGDPLATVTVAAQVGNGPWQLLGTATRAPYTIYHDLDGLAGGTPVRYKAVVRDGRGRLASTTTAITVGTPAAATGDIDLATSKAVWIDRGTVAWQRPDTTDGKIYDLVYARDGGIGVAGGELTGAARSVRLAARRDGLTEAQRTKFPHLWQYRAFRLPRADVAGILRGQVVVTERDAAGKLLAATGVQTAGALDDVYAAAVHATLGPVGTALSVWAPTAHTVALQLYDTPAAAPQTVAMTRDGRTGVWSVRGPASWRGKYYKYRVTAWQPAVHKVVTAAVTDPYSLGLSTDSQLSRIVDLADPALAPGGWQKLPKPAAVDRAKTQISELSVRDFSIADDTVPAAERGTYAAFTHSGSAGMRQLAALAGAGVTHLHLLPVFDFATVPENRADRRQPDCDLAALPPDSDRQQACVTAVADTDGYNWGYDPLHYSTPEGGYAVDPADRTREFRQMVAGINRAGLRVVLDVVYNHTSAAGTDPHAVLDQIVPGYYQRLLADGSVANSTCCANTAPENAMMGKLVVDSIVTWARAYKVDGFRFDLMGHHPKANILAVRAALDKLTLAKDGVDGKNILVYGEGWDFGEVAGNARFEQATQANMAGTGIGTFNDRLRDAVRGGGPFDADPRLQGFASGLFTDPNGDPANGTAAEQRARLLHYQDLIKVGLSGNLASYRFTDSAGRAVTGAQVDYNGSPAGYTGSPAEAVTYVDAHDNEILYDALAYKLPRSISSADRARMQVLALATTALGQGMGFAAAGSSRLRSKSLDRNSFNSGDWFNQILWDCAAGNGFGRGLPPAPDNSAKWQYARPLLADPALIPGCADINQADTTYRELLRIRRSSPLFGLQTAAEVQKRLSFPLSGAQETPGVITMTLDGRGLDRTWRSVTVVFNGTSAAATQTVPALAGHRVGLHPVQRDAADRATRTASFAAATGTFTVPARTVAVFVES